MKCFPQQQGPGTAPTQSCLGAACPTPGAAPASASPSTQPPGREPTTREAQPRETRSVSLNPWKAPVDPEAALPQCLAHGAGSHTHRQEPLAPGAGTSLPLKDPRAQQHLSPGARTPGGRNGQHVSSEFGAKEPCGAGMPLGSSPTQCVRADRALLHMGLQMNKCPLGGQMLGARGTTSLPWAWGASGPAGERAAAFLLRVSHLSPRGPAPSSPSP
ncbi:hypothetical protein KIL84_022101 [Mauremys mutica]|uniref:Uncharacterized protein n=1 Tax=Mauremys mutica TaxID=74926 RepID=A0A9D4B0D0_9SAUR|nr:hypothetical protein KIL84_022101 [Mauremys mutica]